MGMELLLDPPRDEDEPEPVPDVAGRDLSGARSSTAPHVAADEELENRVASMLEAEGAETDERFYRLATALGQTAAVFSFELEGVYGRLERLERPWWRRVFGR